MRGTESDGYCESSLPPALLHWREENECVKHRELRLKEYIDVK